MNVVAAQGLRVDTITVPDGTVRVNTWYAGTLSSEVGPGPQAFSVGMPTPHTNLRAHFHDVSQFQVFVSGSGFLGSDPIDLITVFYTDAYASYGPIIAGPDGVVFYTLRCEHDAGVRWMPEMRGLRKPSIGRRTVWTFDPTDADNVAASRTPGLLDRQLAEQAEDGMRSEFVVAGPHTSLAPVFATPLPRQYVLVLAGQVVADGQLLEPGALLYNGDIAESSDLATGDEGVMLAVMTFPTPVAAAEVA